MAVTRSQETNLGEYQDLCLDVSALPQLGIEEDFRVITIEHLGVNRKAFVYVPPKSSTDEEDQQPFPVIVDIHGSGVCPSIQMTFSGWLDVATHRKFVYVVPLGVTNPDLSLLSCWGLPGGMEVPLAYEGITGVAPECCCSMSEDFSSFTDYRNLQDDVFLRKMVEFVTENAVPDLGVSIDPDKVFVTGHSNGGVAAFAMAALHSDVVSGIAVYAGKPTTAFADGYRPVPVWMVHGQKDREFPYGEVATPGWALDAQKDIFKTFADRNGCAAEIITEALEEEEGYVSRRTNCTNSADVTLVTLTNAGHNPYKGLELHYNDARGATVTVADTTWMACQSLLGDDCAVAASSVINMASRTTAWATVSTMAILLGPFLV